MLHQFKFVKQVLPKVKLPGLGIRLCVAVEVRGHLQNLLLFHRHIFDKV